MEAPTAVDSPFSLQLAHDRGRQRIDPDSGEMQPGPVLSIDQIRSIRANNDYVERPMVTIARVATSSPSSSAQKVERTAEPSLAGVGARSSAQLHHHVQQHLSRSTSTVSSASRSSTTSEHRLLVSVSSSPSVQGIIRAQPKADFKANTRCGARSAGSASAAPAQPRGLCLRAGSVTRGAFAHSRAPWSTALVSAVSRASSTIAPTTTRIIVRTTRAPAAKATAALVGPPWASSLSSCPAYGAICRLKDAFDSAKVVMTASSGRVAGARTPTPCAGKFQTHLVPKPSTNLCDQETLPIP